VTQPGLVARSSGSAAIVTKKSPICPQHLPVRRSVRSIYGATEAKNILRSTAINSKSIDRERSQKRPVRSRMVHLHTRIEATSIMLSAAIGTALKTVQIKADFIITRAAGPICLLPALPSDKKAYARINFLIKRPSKSGKNNFSPLRSQNRFQISSTRSVRAPLRVAKLRFS
jgi:hypothetical protein